MNMHGFSAGILAAPEDGKVAWTTHDDLAAADAALLAGVEVIDGPTPPLTGSEALDVADLARIATAVMNLPVTRTIIAEADMVAGARSAGVPEGAVAVMVGYYRAARAGEFATIDLTLARLLGPTRDDADLSAGKAWLKLADLSNNSECDGARRQAAWQPCRDRSRCRLIYWTG